MDEAIPDWEPWDIHIDLGTMPDGTVAPIGLTIKAREDYDGSRRDQRLTVAKLRRFPLGLVTAAAKHASYEGSDEWERVRLLGDAVLARADAQLLAHEQRMGDFAADLDARVRQVYRDGGLTEREITLQRAADYYREAQRDPDTKSPRQYVAAAMGVSPRTVDVYLADARKEGYLEPYDGPQGKHGKPTPKKRGKK